MSRTNIVYVGSGVSASWLLGNVLYAAWRAQDSRNTAVFLCSLFCSLMLVLQIRFWERLLLLLVFLRLSFRLPSWRKAATTCLGSPWENHKKYDIPVDSPLTNRVILSCMPSYLIFFFCITFVLFSCLLRIRTKKRISFLSFSQITLLIFWDSLFLSN